MKGYDTHRVERALIAQLVLAGTDPAEAAEIVWREKQREDRLRRLENKVARWVWADALVPARMAAILAKEGIRPQARNAWFDVGSAGAPRSA